MFTRKTKPVQRSQRIWLKILLFFPIAALAMGAVFVLTSGSFAYWQGWLFMASLLIPAAFTASYLIRRDPELLERRLRFKEKREGQKGIIKAANLFFFVGILVPGLDYRYGLSHVPPWISIVSDAIIVLGYALVFLAFRENSYASRVVEVSKEQKVISTGPYAVVRHPMYAGIMPMYLFMPLALGSYVALAFFVPVAAVIIPRILDEERALLSGLKGYDRYCRKVRYRLIPGIW